MARTPDATVDEDDEDTMRATPAPRQHRSGRSRRPGMHGLPIAAAAVGLTLLLAACGGDAPGATPAPDPTPTPAPAPTDPAVPTDPASTTVVAVHLVRSAPTDFFIEPVPVRVPAFGDAISARVTAAIDALIALADPADPELFTSVPVGTTLHRVSIDGAVVTIDLSGGIVGSSGSSAQELTFAQQLAHTARVDTTISAIVLLIDGRPITELWGHLDWSRPIEVDPFILSPVTVTTPARRRRGPRRVRDLPPAQATVFEANAARQPARQRGERAGGGLRHGGDRRAGARDVGSGPSSCPLPVTTRSWPASRTRRAARVVHRSRRPGPSARPTDAHRRTQHDSTVAQRGDGAPRRPRCS